MGWMFCTLAGLWEPVRHRIGQAARQARRGAAAHRVPAHASAAPARQAQAATPARPVRAVRVLRVVDTTHPRAIAGRMVISGRMADVCAELDRLAALEGAAG